MNYNRNKNKWKSQKMKNIKQKNNLKNYKIKILNKNKN